MDETDTLPEGGTDNVIPENDTQESWDYYDPDDDQDTAESEQDDGTEDGAQAEEEPAAESEEPDEEPETQTAKITAKVTLSNGEEVTVGELIKGHMRQADYTRKSQELAQSREAIKADTERFERVHAAFVDHLAKMIPPEPDPALAIRDPAAWTAQKAQHDAAVAQVRRLAAIGDEAKAVSQSVNTAELAARRADENARLSMLFPETGTKEGRQRFFETAAKAAEEIGFTVQELSNVMDHRLFALAHWAAKGMAAEKARKTVKSAVQKAPPAAVQKPGQPARQANANKAAMSRLMKSGSIWDAVAVDFE